MPKPKRHFILTLSLDNAAFHSEDGEQPATEIVRILRDLADTIEDEGLDPNGNVILDNNGNTCGTSEVH